MATRPPTTVSRQIDGLTVFESMALKREGVQSTCRISFTQVVRGLHMQATLCQKENKLRADMFLTQLWQQHAPRWHLKEASLRILVEACAKRCPCHAKRILRDVWTWNLCKEARVQR